MRAMNDYKKYGEYTAAQCSMVGGARSAIVYLVLGAGIGALLSLFLAPKSGPELRKAIRDKFDDAVQGLGEQTARLRRRTGQIGRQAREKISPIRNMR